MSKRCVHWSAAEQCGRHEIGTSSAGTRPATWTHSVRSSPPPASAGHPTRWLGSELLNPHDQGVGESERRSRPIMTNDESRESVSQTFAEPVSVLLAESDDPVPWIVEGLFAEGAHGWIGA